MMFLGCGIKMAPSHGVEQCPQNHSGAERDQQQRPGGLEGHSEHMERSDLQPCPDADEPDPAPDRAPVKEPGSAGNDDEEGPEPAEEKMDVGDSEPIEHEEDAEADECEAPEEGTGVDRSTLDVVHCVLAGALLISMP